MKRTEKIEVRLSHEEKQNLSKIAEDEGRTVSDLVRGLIERYVGVTATRLPQKRRWGLWGGLLAGGLLIGHLGTWAFTQSHEGPSIYTMDFKMQTNGQAGYNLSVPIVAKDGYHSELVVPGAEANLRLTATVSESSSELSFLSVHICQIVDELCKTIATPKLNFNPHNEAVISFGTESDSTVYIRVVSERQHATQAL